MNQQLSEEIRESDDPNKKRDLRAMQMEIINKAENTEYKKDLKGCTILGLCVAGLTFLGYVAVKKA
ncbi:hypothetical protein ADJ74_00005 [Selenomonas sp. oral taxon 478]|nr:hypothetical protein ADJ74_00005 [Selenomonas sp. oral taxon 478]